MRLKNKFMKNKVIVIHLLIGFLLFVSCKSSLYDLCPNLFSNHNSNLDSKKVPPCHAKAISENKQTGATDCECPLAYQDFIPSAEKKSEFNRTLNLTYVYVSETFDTMFQNGEPYFLVRKDKHRKNEHLYFLQSVRLLI